MKLAPFIVVLVVVFSGEAHAFRLASDDVAEGKPFAISQVYRGFGCEGGNLSPSLHWSDAPAGTRSFAVTVYDPDAPTGSGWWHWLVYDIPATATGLPRGTAVRDSLPHGARQGRNDFGDHAFGGACPPAGDKPHRYVITVYALKVDKLNVPEEASAALIGFMLNANSLGRTQITAIHSR